MPGLRFHAIAHKPTVVLDMTSLTVDEFHPLVPVVEVAFQAYLVEWRLDGKPRTTRKPTIYKNCPLPTPEDRLLFILVYLKTNPLQVAHGLMFGLPQGKANQWIHVLLPRVQAALRQSGDAPRRSLDALASEFTVPAAADLAALAPPFCHDGTERRIPRPQNGAEQKSHYSGKKKCHTVKNLLLINVPLRILFLRATTAGSVHDKRLADHTPYPLPVGSPLLQDRGFLGFKLVDVDT